MLGLVWTSLCSVSFLQWLLLLGLLGFYLWRKQMAPFSQYKEYPQLEHHWLLGNETFGGETMLDNNLKFYNAIGGHRFGIYWEGNRPAVYLKDLDLIKKVQITDFDHFNELGFGDPFYNDKVGNQFGLASMKGDTWKKMKRMVGPPFSVPRLKKTMPAMNECGRKLESYLKSHQNDDFLDGVAFSKKYYMNTIASIVFGLDIDCYGPTESDFEKYGKRLLAFTNFLLIKFMPTICAYLKIEMINSDAKNFFMKLCKQIVEHRKQSGQEVKDVLQNLIDVGKENPEMTPEMMYKTCVQFFTDGYDSASMALSVLLHHLAYNSDVQERIQEEIDGIFDSKEEDGEIEQEDFNSLQYLDQVLDEGYRVGGIPHTSRLCVKPWKIPGDNFVIPEKMHVIIPIGPMHRDPKYWTEPNIFNPDRFSPENKGKINSVTFQPFGAGPRACLGQNLVRMESKMLLIYLFKKFSIQPFGPGSEDRPWDKEVFIGFKDVKLKLIPRN